MKKVIAIAALLLVAIPAWTEPFNGSTISVTAGTAIRILTTGPDLVVTSIFFQMATGGTGRGYVLYAPSGVTCNRGSAGTTTVGELSPASATAPGGSLTVPMNPDPYGGLVANHWCIDGSHTGDGLIVSFNVRN